MLIMRALLVAAALCVAAPALAQSTDQTQTPSQDGQAGKPHSGHHHHKKQQDSTDSTTAPSQGH
jgi:Spy/CpxP family protein refolding chaperone